MLVFWANHFTRVATQRHSELKVSPEQEVIIKLYDERVGEKIGASIFDAKLPVDGTLGVISLRGQCNLLHNLIFVCPTAFILLHFEFADVGYNIRYRERTQISHRYQK